MADFQNRKDEGVNNSPPKPIACGAIRFVTYDALAQSVNGQCYNNDQHNKRDRRVSQALPTVAKREH